MCDMKKVILFLLIILNLVACEKEKYFGDNEQNRVLKIMLKNGEVVSLLGAELIISDSEMTTKKCAYNKEIKKSFSKINKSNYNDFMIFCLAGEGLKVFAKNTELLYSPPKHLQDNIYLFLRSLDEDQNLKNGIKLIKSTSNIKIKFAEDKGLFAHKLAEKILPLGLKIKKDFIPFLGLNLEPIQGEIDDMAVVPIFVDVFRTSRSFKEMADVAKKPPMKDSPPVLDAQGWPIEIPKDSWAESWILTGQDYEKAPIFGEYTVLYQGVGKIVYEDMATLVKHQAGKDLIKINVASYKRDHATLKVLETSKEDPIRNIRVVMSGGTCVGNPFVRAKSAKDCPSGRYTSFVDRLSKNRNEIIFNPDFLWMLQDFRVLRIMNWMGANGRVPFECSDQNGVQIDACILQNRSWSENPTLEDPTWGGSWRRSRAKNLGVPPEIFIELLNTLKADIWLNIPHAADNTYNQKLAGLLKKTLHKDAKIYLEYSNEVWNPTYWSYKYALLKGAELGLADDNLSSELAASHFYVHRALEVFKIWKKEIPEKRLVRVLSGKHYSVENTKTALLYENAYQKIDAYAVAPYFYGCMSRQITWKAECIDPELVPFTMDEVQSVDEVFAMLNNENDPYALIQTLETLKQHVKVVDSYGLELFAYESGQSLRVDWFSPQKTEEQKQALWQLMVDANRDPRMGKIYTDFLEGWYALGGNQLNLYAATHGYNKWSTYGLQEYALQARKDAPKLDAVLRYQE